MDRLTQWAWKQEWACSYIHVTLPDPATHPVELHVEATGIAHRFALCVAPPEGGGGSVAVGAAEAVSTG